MADLSTLVQGAQKDFGALGGLGDSVNAAVTKAEGWSSLVGGGAPPPASASAPPASASAGSAAAAPPPGLFSGIGVGVAVIGGAVVALLAWAFLGR